MKKIIKFFASLVIVLTLNSCGVTSAYVFNQNQNVTQVHLSENNYKIIDRVQGSAEVPYVLFFGGMKKSDLYASAYANMIDNAELTGSRALINVVTEQHVGGVPPFYYKRTITVSGHVIEFTE